jgi:hypothetical protein
VSDKELSQKIADCELLPLRRIPRLASVQLQKELNKSASSMSRTLQDAQSGDAFPSLWVTVGVVGNKSPPKTTVKGSKFLFMRIGDLDGTEVTVFLFGEVCLPSVSSLPSSPFPEL